MNNELKVIYGIWIFVVASSIIILPLISAALVDNVLSSWHFEESSGDLIDDAGSNDGTVSGTTREQTGIIDNSYFFDGDNDGVNLGGGTDLNFAGDMTISAWVKLHADGAGTQRPIFMIWVGAERNVYFTFEADNKVWAYVGNGGSSQAGVTGTSTPSTGNWHHVVYRRDGSTIKVYVDGVLEKSANTALNGGDTGEDVLIGTWSPVVAGFFEGDLDEIVVWNRAVTDGGVADTETATGEIAELYNSGSGFAYPFVVDTCTCAGAGNNWEIDHSDACVINDDCDLTTGTLSFTGAGTTKINATINTTNLGDPGSSGILRILSNALIWVN